MAKPIQNPNKYAKWKTGLEALMDIGMFTSNFSQFWTITRSPKGVDTGEEIGRTVLLFFCMLCQVILMAIVLYQNMSRDLNDLGQIPPDVVVPAGAEDATMEMYRAKREQSLRKLNYVANLFGLLMVVVNIIIPIVENRAGESM